MSTDRPTADSDVFRRLCEICGTETTNVPIASWVCEDCVAEHDVDTLLVKTETQALTPGRDVVCPRCGPVSVLATLGARHGAVVLEGKSIVDTHPDVIYTHCPDCALLIRGVATPALTEHVADHEAGRVLRRRSR